jgi:hypothetical protein
MARTTVENGNRRDFTAQEEIDWVAAHSDVALFPHRQRSKIRYFDNKKGRDYRTPVAFRGNTRYVTRIELGELRNQMQSNMDIVEGGGSAIPMHITIYLNADRSLDTADPADNQRFFDSINRSEAIDLMRSASEQRFVIDESIQNRMQQCRDATTQAELDAIPE